MFGIGPMELIVVAVFALVFVGPQKLPDMMKQLGRFFVHARRYSSDIRNEFNDVVRKAESEIRLEEAEKLRQRIKEEVDKTKQQLTGEVLDHDHDHNHHDHDHNHHDHDHDHHDHNHHDHDHDHHDHDHDHHDHHDHDHHDHDHHDHDQQIQPENTPPTYEDSPKDSTSHTPEKATTSRDKDPFGDD